MAQRICPNCGKVENEFTYFCTECGSKTELKEGGSSGFDQRSVPNNVLTPAVEEKSDENKAIFETPIDSGIVSDAVPSNNTPSMDPVFDEEKTFEKTKSYTIPQKDRKSSLNNQSIVIGVAVFAGVVVVGIIAIIIANINKSKNNSVAEEEYLVQTYQEAEQKQDNLNEIVIDDKTSNYEENHNDTPSEDANPNFDDNKTEDYIYEDYETESATASEYILPNSDRAYLSKSDLRGLSKEECRLARNELYARHGRKFVDEELMYYFMQFDWYMPRIEPEDFEESMLNDYEMANRDLIVEYEEEMGYR